MPWSDQQVDHDPARNALTWVKDQIAAVGLAFENIRQASRDRARQQSSSQFADRSTFGRLSTTE
ncbi:hypothetical protein ASE23_28220 [Rhizobium sp. Root73]|nr:hypothetical protein ASE23_28220 [Rhizobium sp. Root73]